MKTFIIIGSTVALFGVVLIVLFVWPAPAPVVLNTVVNQGSSQNSSEKFSPSIINGQIGDWARPIPGKVDLIVRFVPGSSLDAMKSDLANLGAEILFTSEYFERFTVRIDEASIRSLNNFTWVRYVDQISPPPTTY